MGSWWSSKYGSQQEPIKGAGPRFKNILFNNFRGIFGVLIPLVALSWQPTKGQPDITVMCLWIWMFWFFLIQPVAVPCTGVIPIFVLPMGGVLSTVVTTRCYFNENIALFILASMLLLLLNNSGYDRRLALWLLCSGDSCQFAGKRLLFKSSLAAFVLSIFSNRLIVTSTITQYVTPIMQSLETTHKSSRIEPNYQEMRYIINNAIQTSSAIGSLALVHSAYATLAFKSIWCETAPDTMEYPDIFNYLQYTVYAFPLALIMWICNTCYHMILINIFVGKPMSSTSMSFVQTELLKIKTTIPKKTSLHEKLTIFFTILLLLIFFFRWNRWSDKGWASYRQQVQATEAPAVMRAVNTEAPFIKDVTVAAIFVIVLHILPKTYNFIRIFTVEKKSELKDLKPESCILWWRFVDQNVNYGYILLLGAGVALNIAIRKSGLGDKVGAHIGTTYTAKEWNLAMFLVCLTICILANIMTGVAAVVCFLPLILNAGIYTSKSPWAGKLYLPALGVGVGATLGFMCPFLNTPAYFCHYVGKVPITRMARYSFLSVVMCMLLLWLSLCYWAPYIWDPNDKGIYPVLSAVTTVVNGTAGAAEPAPAPAPAPEAEPAD